MRTVSPRVLAVASFATALLLHATVYAQNPTQPGAQASVITNPLAASNCSVSTTGANSATSTSAQCNVSGGAGATAYTATSNATATPGGVGIVSATATFSGANPAASITSQASSNFYQYVTLGGPTANIFFATVEVFANLTISSDEPSSIVSAFTSSSIDIGFIDPFTRQPTNNIFASGAYNQDFANDLGGNPGTYDQSVAFTTQFFGSDLNGATEFYFLLYASALVSDQSTSTQLSAFANTAGPVFFFYDAQGNDITNDITVTYQPPVSAVPEPASLTLLVTGFASVAGVARRRRRAALGSN